jgi:hypothetical protein
MAARNVRDIDAAVARGVPAEDARELVDGNGCRATHARIVLRKVNQQDRGHGTPPPNKPPDNLPHCNRESVS